MTKSDQDENTQILETMRTKITIKATSKVQKVEIVQRVINLTALMPELLNWQVLLRCRACEDQFTISMLDMLDVGADNLVEPPSYCSACGKYAPVDQGAEITYELGRFPERRIRHR
jgi:hypothetical protein